MRRSRLMIVKDGLRGVFLMNTKISFMYLGNTSYDQLRQYFSLAVENNLIEKNGHTYHVTEKGWRFINAVEMAEKLIGIERKRKPHAELDVV